MFALRFTPQAVDDIRDILARSFAEHGAMAENRYRALPFSVLDDIRNDPDWPAASRRDDIQPGIRSYHLSHGRARASTAGRRPRRPRHVIMFRVSVAENRIEVLRVLHDAMDLARHLPDP